MLRKIIYAATAKFSRDFNQFEYGFAITTPLEKVSIKPKGNNIEKCIVTQMR